MLPPLGFLPPDAFPPDVFGPGGVLGGASYHVYWNSGNPALPIDYTTPIATIVAPDLSWTTGPLVPGTYYFGVRAFDPTSRLEEANVDARVEVLLDATRTDITAEPLPPFGLTAIALAGGTIRVHWVRNGLPDPVAEAPTGYHVYCGTPTVNLVTPVATVLDTGAPNYHVDIPSLTNDTVYQLAVRAYNATGEEKNTVVVSCMAESVGPTHVDSLTSSATFNQGA